MTPCKGCGVLIDWVTTATGGKMPVQGPVVTVITEEGATVRGRVEHWSSCDKAPLFRKAKP